MNNLSWFLYLSDIAGNIQGLCVAIILVIGIITALCFAAYSMEENAAAALPLGLKLLFRVIVPAVVIAVLIPQKNTMYAIAASELGDRLAHSPQGQELTSDAMKALQQWIKKQIEPEKK